MELLKHNDIAEQKTDSINLLQVKKKAKYFNKISEINCYGEQYFDVLTKRNLTQDYLETFLLYTGLSYKRLNKHERLKNQERRGIDYDLDLSNHAEVLNNLLSTELQKHTIKQDIIAYKGINQSRLKMMLFDEPDSGININKEIPELVGRVIKDRGFLSTSLLPNSANDTSYLLSINVPKGTIGAYIAHVSKHPDEQELLIDKDQSMVITDIQVGYFKTIIYCSLIQKADIKEIYHHIRDSDMQNIKEALRVLKFVR